MENSLVLEILTRLEALEVKVGLRPNPDQPAPPTSSAPPPAPPYGA